MTSYCVIKAAILDFTIFLKGKKQRKLIWIQARTLMAPKIEQIVGRAYVLSTFCPVTGFHSLSW